MNTEITTSELKSYITDCKKTNLNYQIVFRFPNDYGASVIIGPYSYGGNEGLYELAVIKWEGDTWKLCYDTKITHDVIGYLKPDEVISLLYRIKALPGKTLLLQVKSFVNKIKEHYEQK